MDAPGVQLLTITGFSTISSAAALRNALTRAAQRLLPHLVLWVEKGEIRESIDQGQVVGWQVTLTIGLSRSWPKGFAHRSLAHNHLKHMHLFECPIHFHPCGYPIYLDSRWHGQGWEPLFVDAQQDSPTEGEAIQVCPACHLILHPEGLRQSKPRSAREL